MLFFSRVGVLGSLKRNKQTRSVGNTTARASQAQHVTGTGQRLFLIGFWTVFGIKFVFILLLIRVFTVLVFMSGLGMSKIYQPIDKSITFAEKY